MNELYKIASEKKEGKPGVGAQIGVGALGAYTLSKAPKNILGYERVHHGTPYKGAIEGIKKHGLKKSFSGTSAAGADVHKGRATLDEVKGKVYTATNKNYAKAYTDPFGLGLTDSSQVASMKVPYRPKGRMAKDVVLDRLVGKNLFNKAVVKLHGIRVYKHSIPTRFIENSDGYKGVKQFATAGNMRRYLSQPGGKLRFAKGLAQIAGGAALLAQVKKIQDKKSSK